MKKWQRYGVLLPGLQVDGDLDGGAARLVRKLRRARFDVKVYDEHGSICRYDEGGGSSSVIRLEG